MVFLRLDQYQKYISYYQHIPTYIGAELGGAAGARAPPLLHNPRKFIVWGENSPKFPVPALY